MSLKDSVKRGGGATGTRLVIYADTKAGKTTTASQAPKPLFMGTDDGFRRLTVDGLESPKTWNEFLTQLGEVVQEAPAAGYKTVVIDTIDGIADLCATHICDAHFGGLWADKKNGFLAWGGHQGWAAVSEEMKRVLPLLDQLVDVGFWVILLAHQKVEKVSDPIEGDYDRFSPDVHKAVWSRLAAWADAILRISFDVTVGDDGKAICDGTRMLKCAATSAEVAGTRAGYELPATMPLAWANIEEKLGAADGELCAKAAEKLLTLDDDDQKKALKYLSIKTIENIDKAAPHKLKTLLARIAAKGAE